jgi:ribosomal protein S18 acetylase RimI-like enzyme
MLQVSAADSRDVATALALLYRRWPAGERDRLVRDALQSAALQTLDLKHLLIARSLPSDRVLGAVLGIERPGREAVVWLPGVADGASVDGVGGLLLTELSHRLDRAGMVCAVVFVDPNLRSERALLDFAGFPHLADLCLMQTRGPLRTSPRWRGDTNLDCIPWREDLAEQFATTIEQTQREAQDCPEVGSFRTGGDVLASHGAMSQPQANLWRLYRQRSAPDPIGILLLGELEGTDELEIQYLGVVPHARRQGVARQLLAEARAIAEARGKTRLHVAVESRNQPARALYESDGFQEIRRYAIHLRLNPHAAPVAS